MSPPACTLEEVGSQQMFEVVVDSLQVLLVAGSKRLVVVGMPNASTSIVIHARLLNHNSRLIHTCWVYKNSRNKHEYSLTVVRHKKTVSLCMKLTLLD